MTDLKYKTARTSDRVRAVKAPYRTPRLEVLGSLRTATRGSGGMGADAALGMTMMSDRRTKEEILEIGRHPLGVGIYRFRYKAPYAELYGAGRRVGVMADEVAEKYPDAVCRHTDGYLRVDYGRLFRYSPGLGRYPGFAIARSRSQISRSRLPELSSVVSACDNPTQFLQRAIHDVLQA